MEELIELDLIQIIFYCPSKNNWPEDKVGRMKIRKTEIFEMVLEV